MTCRRASPTTFTSLRYLLPTMIRLFFKPRDVIRRQRLLAMMVIILVAIIVLGQLGFNRFLTINPTDSLPRGVYMNTMSSPAVGELVEFRTPESVVGNIDRRFDYLIKPIAAGPGDDVDTTSGAVVINGCAVAHSALLEHDSQDRAIIQWRDKRRLNDDEFFVLSTRVPNSLDSRYFGPIRRDDIISVRSCLWSWDDKPSIAQ